MIRETLFRITVEDSAAIDPERVREMTRMLLPWADPERPKNARQAVAGQDYQPVAIGRILGNQFSADDVRIMEGYIRKLIGRNRAWLAEQRVLEPSEQARMMILGAESNLQRIERTLADFVEGFRDAEREARLDDLPPRHVAA
jgi:hypothetical protein